MARDARRTVARRAAESRVSTAPRMTRRQDEASYHSQHVMKRFNFANGKPQTGDSCMTRSILKSLRGSTALLIVALAFGVLGVPAARAAGLVVNSTADTTVAGDGKCTLREAMLNASAGGDTT